MKVVAKVSEDDLDKINLCIKYYVMFVKSNTVSTWNKYFKLYKSLDYVGKEQVLTKIKAYLEEQKNRKNERK